MAHSLALDWGCAKSWQRGSRHRRQSRRSRLRVYRIRADRYHAIYRLRLAETRRDDHFWKGCHSPRPPKRALARRGRHVDSAMNDPQNRIRRALRRRHPAKYDHHAIYLKEAGTVYLFRAAGGGSGLAWEERFRSWREHRKHPARPELYHR